MSTIQLLIFYRILWNVEYNDDSGVPCTIAYRNRVCACVCMFTLYFLILTCSQQRQTPKQREKTKRKPFKKPEMRSRISVKYVKNTCICNLYFVFCICIYTFICIWICRCDENTILWEDMKHQMRTQYRIYGRNSYCCTS